MRHLPRHYHGTSVYSLFPFFTPPVMKDNLAKLGTVTQYTDTDGKRPAPLPVPKVVDTVAGIRYVAEHPTAFAQVTVLGRGAQLLAQDDVLLLADKDTAP